MDEKQAYSKIHEATDVIAKANGVDAEKLYNLVEGHIYQFLNDAEEENE